MLKIGVQYSTLRYNLNYYLKKTNYVNKEKNKTDGRQKINAKMKDKNTKK